MFQRRLTLLIFADWIPPDFCASRSFLTLATGMSQPKLTPLRGCGRRAELDLVDRAVQDS
jgi:hypothetical protein